jgi:hypothetical protein
MKVETLNEEKGEERCAEQRETVLRVAELS